MKFSGRHFPQDVILTTIRWYLRYKLSYREIEELLAELLAERGIDVDHSTLNRWVIKYAPLLMAKARYHKRTVGVSWRFDETYIKVRDQWKYLYRAVDKQGDTVDFLLTAKRNTRAALRFLRQAIRNNSTPVKNNIDKSGANTAAIEAYNEECGSTMKIRQCKYLNNIVEQDHQRVKLKTRTALGFKAFYSAHAPLQGAEFLQMIRKGQVRPISGGSYIEQFNRLAMSLRR
jgi:putative transposase